MGNSERTNVVIVGAGASKEFGLPTGDELANNISNWCRLEFDSFGKFASGNRIFLSIVNKLSRHPTNGLGLERYNKAADQIVKNMSLAPSIDNFLHTHKENDVLVEVGKIAIAACILDAEKSSTLRVENDNIYTKLEFIRSAGTWIGQYFSLLVTHRGFEEFLTALEEVTFICFNYDRCIEQYFLNAARSYFDLDDADSNRIKEALHVIHPYGSLGDLELRGLQTHGYGAAYDINSTQQFASGIQTFTEGVNNKQIKPAINHALANCDLLIFLGFSFHPLNMKLLETTDKFNVRRVLATGKGLSKESQELIRFELFERFLDTSTILDEVVSIVDGTCADLFYEHHRFLSVNG